MRSQTSERRAEPLTGPEPRAATGAVANTHIRDLNSPGSPSGLDAFRDEPESPVDLLVIGGGINGTGVARDAARRGMRVVLCEQHDLAAHTSSASTKLIHGGLRYLEYYEFALVRKALKEREVLMRSAPHIIRPLRFVMPHVPSLRPAWLIRAGLFLYDHLSRREVLPASRSVKMSSHPSGLPLVDSIKRGFIYSDAWVDDARLVVLNAMAAAEHGARILTRTRVAGARRIGTHWHVTLAKPDGQTATVTAKALVNAAGPWVDVLLKNLQATDSPPQSVASRLVKGSHIVTRKLFDHDHAYIFQNPDKRIIFAIPYEHAFTLIGTTDLEFTGDPASVTIDAAEVAYLCDAVNRYFKKKVLPRDVVWTYSGVRPLFDQDGAEASAVTRDYHLELNAPPRQAPLLSVFGGKITTFRKLAEQAVDQLSAALEESPASNDSTSSVNGQHIHRPAEPHADQHADPSADPLPGGDLPDGDFDAFVAQTRARFPWLQPALARRYAHAYGTRLTEVIGAAGTVAELGMMFAPGLYEAELDYLRNHEWALCAEDVLWRRSKLGLHVPEGTAQRIDTWFRLRGGPVADISPVAAAIKRPVSPAVPPAPV